MAIQMGGIDGQEDQGSQEPAQPARGAEVSGSEGAGYSYREVGAGGNRPEFGRVSFRNAGAAWSGAIEFIGGIVTRLLSDKEERIREVQACIIWYQDELIKREAELADLQQFAHLVSAEISGEPESDLSQED